MRRKTSNDYIRHVRTFTTFLGRSPDGATAKDLRRCSPTQDGFPTSAVLRRITIQDGGRHRRWRWADARRWRTCLLGVDHGEQLPHGARRQAPSVSLRWIVSVADEIIAPREFAVCKLGMLRLGPSRGDFLSLGSFFELGLLKK